MLLMYIFGFLKKYLPQKILIHNTQNCYKHFNKMFFFSTPKFNEYFIDKSIEKHLCSIYQVLFFQTSEIFQILNQVCKETLHRLIIINNVLAKA